MKSLLYILLLLPITATATDMSGAILNNTRWTKEFSPYYLVANVGVSDGCTLVVEAGVEVYSYDRSSIYGSGYSLIVNGVLIANGTADDSITFSGSPPDCDVRVCPFPQTWGGIQLNNTAAETGGIFTYCNIRNTTIGIDCESTAVIIKNCYVDGSLSAVTLKGDESAESVIQYSTIRGRGTARGIVIAGQSPLISHNRIIGSYGSITCMYGNVRLIQYNDIYGPFGVGPDYKTGTINAEFNYWGVSTEDSIISNHYFNGTVDYVPWLTEPYNGHTAGTVSRYCMPVAAEGSVYEVYGVFNLYGARQVYPRNIGILVEYGPDGVLRKRVILE